MAVLPRVDYARLDATTEADIARHEREDELEAMQDAARYVRRIRMRIGMTQARFAESISVSLETIRNWEQGKREPDGAAKALLRLIDHMPEQALEVLSQR